MSRVQLPTSWIFEEEAHGCSLTQKLSYWEQRCSETILFSWQLKTSHAAPEISLFVWHSYYPSFWRFFRFQTLVGIVGLRGHQTRPHYVFEKQLFRQRRTGDLSSLIQGSWQLLFVKLLNNNCYLNKQKKNRVWVKLSLFVLQSHINFKVGFKVLSNFFL